MCLGPSRMFCVKCRAEPALFLGRFWATFIGTIVLRQSGVNGTVHPVKLSNAQKLGPPEVGDTASVRDTGVVRQVATGTRRFCVFPRRLRARDGPAGSLLLWLCPRV